MLNFYVPCDSTWKLYTISNSRLEIHKGTRCEFVTEPQSQISTWHVKLQTLNERKNIKFNMKYSKVLITLL